MFNVINSSLMKKF